MNRENHENFTHIGEFSLVAKFIAKEYSYKPGPLMEEKIIRKIKRSKLKRVFFKMSIVITIAFIILFTKFESVQPFRIKQNFSSFQQTIENQKLISSNSKTLTNIQNMYENNMNDLLFKTLRYTAIASDGDW
ncbi:hypothetical protein QQE94_04465 [Fervidobacterium pennivorans subsp. shakshaketiis]|jgi:hypothetical protein|uniref:Uncharacterized protein n=1 Tax=Fervidobacterium pennivorans (strain DSM 9078 / Ven5) TaxID=771875 RepID=H9UC20_FERPD|nr:hypothetical protein [Fervidobacterium pennivorans]AFG35063.1 hypothetical protein Ferpe_0953 [Fervidobacterium pennivorans DSM 9078]QIV78527.1 hypothetical protein HER11_05990 [Fervidobacterium pennivorans subsp. keratinolyticus]